MQSGDDGVDSPPGGDGTDADNLNIVLTGVAGAAFEIEETATVTLIDKDQASTGITLSFDPKDVSEEAGRTKVRVTATLNGETVKHNLTFSLAVLSESRSHDRIFGPKTADDFAGRDSHYDLDPLGNSDNFQEEGEGISGYFH